jgi:hypothetical protein
LSERLVLSPSPALAAVIVALHAAAGVSALLVAGGLAGAALGTLLLGLGVAAAWSRALLGARGSVRAIEIDGSSLTLETRDGERVRAAAPMRCYVSRFAVALPSPRAVLVSADMLGRADFRRLRLWALWGRLPAVAGKQLPA